MAWKHFQQEATILINTQNLQLSMLTNTSKSKETHPATYRKRKFLDSKIIYAIPERLQHGT